MANANPYQARLAAALRRKPGDIDNLRVRTWAALLEAYTDCGVSDPEQRRKNLLAYAQLAGVYVKIHAVGELEGRLQRLEALVQESLADASRKRTLRVV